MTFGTFLLFSPEESLHYDFNQLIKLIKGNYYYFIIEENRILTITGFLNLNPVYYSPQYLFATNLFGLVTEMDIERDVSERFILESFLFNYPFFNSTIYKQVLLLSTHSVLETSHNAIAENFFFKISDILTDKPLSKSADYNKLVSVFIETVNRYVPESNSAISFTSGFDGRTIVSAALYLKKKFSTFSFGRIENDDVYVPVENARDLSLEFKHLDPANQHYKENFSGNAKELSLQNGGFNGFLYPHFLYMAKVIAAENKYMIMGYGGSELLRATHITGAITSKALYEVITIDDSLQLKQSLLKNQAIRFLSDKLITDNIDELVSDLVNYKKQLATDTSLYTLNRKLYFFLLNETIRKVFGVWQASQGRYIKVRCPFLDYDLIKQIYQTRIAGVYNDFFTENPLKRFKGQLLYALIIKKTNKIIFNQKTGKGYKPKNLLSLYGKMVMVYPFIKKRFMRKIVPESLDNLGIISGLKEYINKMTDQEKTKLFNEELINALVINYDINTPEYKRDALLNYFSILVMINAKKKKHKV